MWSFWVLAILILTSCIESTTQGNHSEAKHVIKYYDRDSIEIECQGFSLNGVKIGEWKYYARENRILSTTVYYDTLNTQNRTLKTVKYSEQGVAMVEYDIINGMRHAYNILNEEVYSIEEIGSLKYQPSIEADRYAGFELFNKNCNTCHIVPELQKLLPNGVDSIQSQLIRSKDIVDHRSRFAFFCDRDYVALADYLIDGAVD